MNSHARSTPVFKKGVPLSIKSLNSLCPCPCPVIAFFKHYSHRESQHSPRSHSEHLIFLQASKHGLLAFNPSHPNRTPIHTFLGDVTKDEIPSREPKIRDFWVDSGNALLGWPVREYISIPLSSDGDAILSFFP